MKQENWNLRRFLFGAIFIFAGIVRLKNLYTGLPLHTLYGENDTLQILLRMIHTGNLNPGQFDLPGLAYYLYLPFLYVFYFAGNIFGYFTDPSSVPGTSYIYIGRVVCALFGTATVYLIYRIGNRYSTGVGLFAMCALAASPQHIEFSHMLRPEIPAIFFVLLGLEAALSILNTPGRAAYWLFGLSAGASFSIKYTVGLPLLLIILYVHWKQRRHSTLGLLLQSFLAFFFVFAITNPFVITNPEALFYWTQRVRSLYVPGEDYYGKNIFYYYLEFLTRYDYGLPLMLFAGAGILLSLKRNSQQSVAIAIYPVTVFLWLCSFETRRVHGLLPIHPFLALWAALPMEQIWRRMQIWSQNFVWKLAYTLLTCAILFAPYYRTGVQSYLFSKVDNRSKAELWMTNRLPQGSRIAMLQFQQMELDPDYFQIQDFVPKDYVLNNKDFVWFRDHGFDYIAVSSGQYMRYFTEGEKAQRYRNYFLRLFQDGTEDGTLILDLITHPLVIPDYRIKIFSTRSVHAPPGFIPAIVRDTVERRAHLSNSGAVLSLPPGYYLLELSGKQSLSFAVTVRNLKLQETILEKKNQALSAGASETFYPFAIFPVRETARFSLFSRSQPEMSPNQLVQFQWQDVASGLDLKRIEPAIEVISVDVSPKRPYDPAEPYLLFDKTETFHLKCSLHNRTESKVAGYVEGFLSEIGEPQPWKAFESASNMQEFFLEGGQAITIDVPMNTGTLTGDHQLSYWIFTRQDLPFSPQNGGWFNKQIRVKDPKLGVHSVYGIPIP